MDPPPRGVWMVNPIRLFLFGGPCVYRTGMRLCVQQAGLTTHLSNVWNSPHPQVPSAEPSVAVRRAYKSETGADQRSSHQQTPSEPRTGAGSSTES